MCHCYRAKNILGDNCKCISSSNYEYFQSYRLDYWSNSVEDLLLSGYEVISSINSHKLGNQGSVIHLGNRLTPNNIEEKSTTTCISQCRALSSLNQSSHSNKTQNHKEEYSGSNSSLARKHSANMSKSDEQQSRDVANKSSELTHSGKNAHEGKKESRGERSKKKSSWYNVLYPTYKSRSEDFKRIFKDVPDDERLVVDYSCALQREILVHGRLYVSQNYVCFYANIFSWETLVSLRWKDVTSITKEKTALVIPNAILICTANEKFFLTSFGARDKTYVMLFRVWQNALIGEPMSAAEMWQLVHTCYGDELGLTSDDEDYVPPLPVMEEEKLPTRVSVESFSEVESGNTENLHSATTDTIVQPESEVHATLNAEPNVDLTDLSDTTESEAEKHGSKTSVRGTAVCSAIHEGREIGRATFPMHIDQLFTLLFTNSKFMLDFHTARKTTDLVQSAWTQNDETGQKTRTVTLTVALTQAIGPRNCRVTETQIMLPCSKPGVLYSIDAESMNAGIPYAESFSVVTHFCITSVTENESSIAIYAQIKYKKNVWSFVKNVIEKNCWAGLEEYYTSLVKVLAAECEEGNGNTGIKRKTRRRRRTTGPAVTLQSQIMDHTITNHQTTSPVDIPRIHDSTGRNTKLLVPGARSDSSMIVSSMLLIAVLCLMVINGLLYYKLWGLEETAAYTIMDLHVLKNTPKTEEDWINLLQQQESLHNVEMKKWQRVLHTAAQLLRQTEESLTELQMSIHPTATEKMFSVLKPSLKSLTPRNEQRSNSEL